MTFANSSSSHSKSLAKLTSKAFMGDALTGVSPKRITGIKNLRKGA